MSKLTDKKIINDDGKIEMKEFKSFLENEKALNKFFREFGFKANHSQLIRAFLEVCEGQVQFEVSYKELANHIFKTNLKNRQNASANVRNNLKSFEKWQEKNKITLIRIVQNGQRLLGANGRFNYTKTQFEFTGLAQIVEVLYSDAENLEATINDVIKKLKQDFQPLQKKEKYHPNHLIKKAKNCILTKLKKVFELALLAKANPVDICQKTLNEGWEVLSQLENNWNEELNTNQIIDNFEKKYQLET